MKHLLYIVCFLILVSGVFAADMEVSEVRGYVNDDRESNVDEDGGSMDAQVSDSIDYIVTMKNNLNLTGQFKMRLTVDNIDNGNDITKDLDWTTVDALSEKSKMLSFIVPDDASNDDYPVTIKITYKHNSSETAITKDYEIVVRKQTKEINLQESFNNLTLECVKVTSGLNTCFGYMNDSRLKSDELSSCKEQRGTADSNFNNCNTNLNDCNNKKATCEAEKAAMGERITKDDCTNLYVNPAIKKEKSSLNNLIFFVIAAGLGGFIWWKYKKNNISVDSSYMNQG